MDSVTIKIGADASAVRPAIDDSGQALGELSGKVADTKQGMADLAVQVAEASKQLINGANPLTVFAEHSHDVFSAISEVTKVTSGFVDFMGGPWGLAISAAVGVVGTLVSKFLETRNGAEAAAGGVRDHNVGLDGLGSTTLSTAAAIKTLNDAQLQDKSSELVGSVTALAQSRTQQAKATLAAAKAEAQLRLSQAKARTADLADGFVGRIKLGTEGHSTRGGYVVSELQSARIQATEDARRAQADIDRLDAAYKHAIDTFTAQAKAASVPDVRVNTGAPGKPPSQYRGGTGGSDYSAKLIHITASTADVTVSSVKISASSLQSSSSNAGSALVAADNPFPSIEGAADKPFEIAKGHIETLKQQIAGDMKVIGKVGDQTADDQNVKWKSVANSISSAFSSSLQGMIKGTQNFRGMMLNIGNAILGEATKWIQKKVSAFLTGELTQTAATTAGVTARTSVEAAGAATSTGISAMAALTQIGHSAAVAAAGAYAAIAKIDFIGPVLAPLAAAAALAGVLALGKSIFSAEGGMGQVPYDGAMFELHKDEMVLPASLATPMRSMLLNPVSTDRFPTAANGNSPSDGDVHLHIHAVDAQSGVNFLMRNKHAVARAVNGAVRNGFKAKG